MRTNPTLSAPSVSTSLAPAPYGLRPLSYQPVRIETPAGKATYVDAQRDFAARGHVLRLRLIDACDTLLTSALAG